MDTQRGLRAFAARDWAAPAPHDAARTLRAVQVVGALVLIAHPLHALLSPGDAPALAERLGAHHIPAAGMLAWAALGLALASAAALLVRRWTGAATLGAGLVLLGGAALTLGPYWYAVGGGAHDEAPGVEFNLMLLAALGTAYWARSGTAERTAERALDVLRWATALILLTHPLHAFTDFPGMRAFGHFFDRPWFPFGVALVWTTMGLQITCCLLLLARRLVVPACLGHLFVLALGVRIAHFPNWFVVGPGRDGMEYSFLLMASFAALLVAHWPRAEAPDAVEAAG